MCGKSFKSQALKPATRNPKFPRAMPIRRVAVGQTPCSLRRLGSTLKYTKATQNRLLNGAGAQENFRAMAQQKRLIRPELFGHLIGSPSMGRKVAFTTGPSRSRSVSDSTIRQSSVSDRSPLSKALSCRADKQRPLLGLSLFSLSLLQDTMGLAISKRDSESPTCSSDLCNCQAPHGERNAVECAVSSTPSAPLR